MIVMVVATILSLIMLVLMIDILRRVNSILKEQGVTS
jgi:lipopolysaccharide export LptBFGC system permease protein LptF